MKLNNYKILGIIFALTFIAVIYVNQQALIYQMGLKLKSNQEIYSKLVDHNKILVYNVLSLRSPVKLQTKLLNSDVQLAMPCKWQVVKVEHSTANNLISFYKNVTKKGLFANLLGMGREAEASPNINIANRAK